jgi:ABC-type multidrug transport system ATPase subunit
MEEADALSDRIAEFVDGKIKCDETPLNIKNKFGDE